MSHSELHELSGNCDDSIPSVPVCTHVQSLLSSTVKTQLNSRKIESTLINTHRMGDPIFALTMGVAAALSRIRRDQQEKNPDRASEIGYRTVMQLGQRRLQRWWNGDFRDL